MTLRAQKTAVKEGFTEKMMTRDLFKKIRDTKGTFHAKMDTVKDRSGMSLIEAEEEVARIHKRIVQKRFS